MIHRLAAAGAAAFVALGCNDSNDPVLPPAPTALTWGAVAFTDQRGPTTGGTAYADACPDGEAVTGYRGTFHASGYLGQMQAICGTLTLSTLWGPVVAVTAGTTFPMRGRPGVGAWTAVCPAGQVVIGFGGRSGGLVDKLILRCAPLTISAPADAYVIAVGTAVDLAPVGGDGGSAFDQTDCPLGSVAVVSNIRASDGVDAFGLGCSEPALEF